MRPFSGKPTWLLFLTVLGAVLCGVPSYTQVVTGSMLGTITDASGAVVPGAKVTITDLDTNVARADISDSSGNYSVTDLPPGPYKVSAEKEGFRVATHTDITLFAAATVRVDITLEPGSITQAVTVAGGAAPLLQTDTAETGRALDSTLVEDLPLSVGHNFQNLLSLAPGTEPAERQHSIFYNAQNGMSAPADGVPGRANFFNIEGLNNNQRSGELPVYIPAMEAIQEVAITSSNYDPAQGAALGSVVNVIIKSGSNSFHGEAYEIYTGSALDARNFFAYGPGGAPFHKAHSVDNYFGGNIGGPIRKDKTFFFVDYFYHPTLVNNFYSFSVPTAAMRQGNFASDPSLPEIFDPTTGDEADCLPGGNAKLCGTGRTQITSGGGANILKVDPVAAALISHVALPTIATTSSGKVSYSANLPFSSPLIQNTPDLDVKIDHYLAQHDHISGRFSYQDPSTNQAGPWGNYGGPISVGGTAGTEGTGHFRITSEGINWTHVISPTLLTEARVGANRYNNVAHQIGYGTNLSTQVGVPGLDFNPNSSGLFAVTGEGFSDPLLGAFSSLPWIHAQTNIVFADNTTKIHGNHTLEFGLDYFRIRDDYIFQAYQFGNFGFGPGPTSLNAAGAPATSFANNFADFLLGVPTGANQGFIYHYPSYRQNQFFPYFGDKWQATKKLTVNAGLRWEYYGPPTSHFAGDFANYNPSTNVIEVNGIGGIPNNLGVQRDLRDWAPRLGLAYRLTGHDVLRAGFGMSSMAYPLDIYASLDYPVATEYTWSSLSSFGPDILNGAPGSFEAGFPPIPPAVIPSNGLIPVTGNAALTNTTMYYAIPTWRHPYVMSWNAAYQRELPGGWFLDLAYVGNRTVDASMYNNMNAATSYGSGAAGQPEYPTFGRAAATDVFFDEARGAYDSLQIKMDHHFAHNFSVTTSYTWGKAMGPSGENSDYVSGYSDYVNIKRNWAPTDFNLASMFSQSFMWFLPFGKGKALLNNSRIGDAVLGGWELSGAWIAHTGFPLDFSTNASNFNTPGTTQTPNITGPFQITHQIGTGTTWFNTSAFSFPSAGTQGNLGYYTFQGPGLFNLNTTLSRMIRLNERFKLLIRTEWLSATNTPQFAPPNTQKGSSSFGVVNSTISSATGLGGSRVIDLVGKLIF